MTYQATDAVAGPSRSSEQSVQGWRSTTSSFASTSINLDPMQGTKHSFNHITNSAPVNSPLFDCVNIQTSTNVTPQSTLSSSASYFQSGSSNPTNFRTKVEKDLPDLPPSEDDSISDFSGSHDTREDAYIDNSAAFRQFQDKNHSTQSPVLSNVQDVQSVSSNGLFNRLSPAWSSAVKPRGKKESLNGSRKPTSRNGVSPGRGEESTLVGLGVESGRLARASNSSSMADTTASTSQGDQGHNAWSNRAAAVKAASQTAGVGLKKWGKASAAKIRQQTQQRQASGSQGSPTIGNWGRVGTASLGNLRRFDGRAAKSSADLPMTSSDGDQSNTFPPNTSTLSSIHPDPRIGLPTDVRHNVHVDVGPQGYTGLPASWAQVLAQYGMDANEVRKDPAGAIALIRQRTQYYVDKEAELGQDPESTKKLLESRLGQLEELQDARDAVRSVTPGPRASHHDRRSSDNATKSDATLRRISNASTTYSSVLNTGWPPSPSWSDAPSLPQIPSQHISPSLPLVQADDSDDDWGASLLKSLPKSDSEENQLYSKGGIQTSGEDAADSNIEALADDLNDETESRQHHSFNEKDHIESLHESESNNAEDETGSILTASRIPTSKVVRNPQLFTSPDPQDISSRRDKAPSEQSSRGTNDTPSNARFASPEARDSSCTSHSIQSSLDDSYSFGNDTRTFTTKTPAITYGQSTPFSPSSAEAQPAGTGNRISSGERRSSTQNEISKQVSEGLRERRKNAARIYPPSSNKFVGQADLPSPRSIGFKPALSVRTSGTSQNGGKAPSFTTISNGSDASLSQGHSLGNHFIPPSPSQSPAISSSKESNSLHLGDSAALQSNTENDPNSISKTMRNSGASVRLASQPLQMHFDHSNRRQGSHEGELDPPPALPYKQARVSPGQITPDFIHPDADGFFRPSSTSASSAGHVNNTDRKITPKELQIPPTLGGDGMLAPEVKAQDGISYIEEDSSSKSPADKSFEPFTDRLSTDRKSDSISTTPSGSNFGVMDDYQPASDFLDDWLNDEDDRDPSPGYGHSQSTGSDRAQSPYYDQNAPPQPPLPIAFQMRNEPDAHQSPSPALLKGLPTPLRAQFNTSLQIPPPKEIDESNLSPVSQIHHSLGRPIDEEKVGRDWRVRSLPPPPPEEEEEGEDIVEIKNEDNTNSSDNLTNEKNGNQLSGDRLSVVSLPLHDFDSIDDQNGPPKADSEAQELAALTRPGSRQSRPNSRASRSSSRAGSRHLRRRSSDARRFPISMHYSSGFDAEAFGADSEAISSFADLMRARQSMDLDDVMPMRLDSMMDVPPVPALPATLNKEQAHVIEQESVKSSEIDMTCPSHLRSFVHPGKPQEIFEKFQLIGEGESGDVFSAIPKMNCGVKSMEGSKMIAIKVVRMSSSQTHNSEETGRESSGEKEESQSNTRLAHLDEELSLWRKASGHENILTLFEIFLCQRSDLTSKEEGESQLPTIIRDGIWIVQECMSMSLADLIALKMEGLEMNESHMARIFGDICAAMHHIHSKGIVHRDVRSDNILLTFDGKAKLTDFTHATSLSPNEKRNSVVGTTYWMAPEVIKAEFYDQKADIWSLGAVLYELIEGVPPRVEFPALRAITLTVQLGLPPLQEPQKYSTALKECFAWCSELQPENRPSADMILEGEFVACASSYEEMHTLIREAQAMEAETDNDHEGQEEEVLQERNSRSDSSAQHHARDSWTSQSTVQG